MAKAATKAQTENFLKDLMDAVPVDTAALEGAYKSGAELNEKLAAVALTAAEGSTEISTAWTRETLAALGTVSQAKVSPTDYTKELTDFVTAQANLATDKVAALAEVTKSMQAQSLEILLSAAKGMGADALAAAAPAK